MIIFVSNGEFSILLPPSLYKGRGYPTLSGKVRRKEGQGLRAPVGGGGPCLVHLRPGWTGEGRVRNVEDFPWQCPEVAAYPALEGILHPGRTLEALPGTLDSWTPRQTQARTPRAGQFCSLEEAAEGIWGSSPCTNLPPPPPLRAVLYTSMALPSFLLPFLALNEDSAEQKL